jgi:hypothetical protein
MAMKVTNAAEDNKVPIGEGVNISCLRSSGKWIDDGRSGRFMTPSTVAQF